jgi:6-oxo-cyclohex-1-ene-carbonyl-CoA hydrolase
MSLDWLPREGALKNHDLYDDTYLNGEPPTVNYELKPIVGGDGKAVSELHSAWITLNNPTQYNSYTTEMVKGVIGGFHRASMDRTVVAVVFTAVGDRAFCTGGNTKEYAEYYSGKPTEYALYMDLFNAMVDAILMCKKPVICRVNGMRIAGGQEIGMACDLTLSGDNATFGQAGPRHGSAPDGGSTDFLPWYLSIEDALWNCVSCEIWSAYKMKRLSLISKVAKVYKENDRFIPNPMVITDSYVREGDIVYGEFLTGDAGKAAREKAKMLPVDFSLLDKEVDKILWTFTNLFPHCLMKSIDGIRTKKKFFWDQAKLANRHWLASNMSTEAFLGFHAFNTKKITGSDVIDFIKYRQLIAEGHVVDEDFFEQVLAKPKT